MTENDSIVKFQINNWNKYQSAIRSDRPNSKPTWVKLHKIITQDKDFYKLTVSERLWYILSLTKADHATGELPAWSDLSFEIRCPDFDPKMLIELGFFIQSGTTTDIPTVNRRDTTDLPMGEGGIPPVAPDKTRSDKTRSDNKTPCPKKDKETVQQTIEKSILDELFDDFWSAYPKKQSKKDAQKAWKKLSPDMELCQAILRGIKAQKESKQWSKDNGEFIPLPATWIRGEKWNDETPDRGFTYHTNDDPEDAF